MAQVPYTTTDLFHTIYPQGHPFIELRAEFHCLRSETRFAPLVMPVWSGFDAPITLALTTILQLAYGFNDAQAAEAVRMDIRWKYLLDYDLDEPGFNAEVLATLRQHAEAVPCRRLL
jgi:hypothetical protein